MGGGSLIKNDRAIVHERKRFSTLTPKQLETRLLKIKATNRKKLEAYILVALEHASRADTAMRKQRYEILAARAKDKLEGRVSPGHQIAFDFGEEQQDGINVAIKKLDMSSCNELKRTLRNLRN